jgi:RNA polymerase sigma-70 factor (ECF subfamily)
MLPASSPAESAPVANDDALERLTTAVRDHRRTLSGIARQEGLTPEEAIDCVQGALCTLLDLVRTEELEAGADPAAVLGTIVRNAARNQRRRHYRAKPHVDFGARDLANEALALPEEHLSRAEDTVRLRACVEELCEIQRAVVTLRFLEERPGEDVAELLGVTKNHVAVLLHRAKASLRECVLSDGGDGAARTAG